MGKTQPGQKYHSAGTQFILFSTFKTYHSLQLEYVVGWVIGEVFSSVSGYILNNIFYGSIFINNDIYYVDPSKVKLKKNIIYNL